MKKSLLIAVLLFSIIGVGFLIASDSEEAASNQESSQIVEEVEPDTNNDLVAQQPIEVAYEKRFLSQNQESTINLVEFSDFECPACAAYHPILKQIITEYDGRVNFEFVHFPLSSIHPNAMIAHQIAEAAALQGKFVEVHNILYENQIEWSNAQAPKTTIYRLIENVDLDMDQLKFDANSPEVAAQIENHIERGNEQNVTGTPSFFVGSEQYTFLSLEDMRSKLNALLSPL